MGQRIYHLLEEKGITQKELSEALHIAPTTLIGYLKDRRRPDIDTLVRMVSYFNTTTDYLYGMTALEEPYVSPYNAEECRLIHVYRAIPDDKKPLFIETGKLFCNYEENKPVKRRMY